MKITKTLNKVLTAGFLVTVGSAFAQDAEVPFVSFNWSQADPNPATGSGELTATINGVEFSASMPTPVINQKSTTDQPIPADLGIVGFANTVDDVQPGTPNGFHLGWSGSIVMTGSIDDADDPNTDTSAVGKINNYIFEVNLNYENGGTYSYQADVFDDPTGDHDVTGGKHRFAGWLGDDGAGHRHSGPDNQNYGPGQDAFSINAGGNLGSNGMGDKLGITLSLRDGTGGTVFVSNLVFAGTIIVDDSNFMLNENSDDTDGDGLDDIVETNTGVYVSKNDTGTNPLMSDTDGDGLKDSEETNTGKYVSFTDTGTDPSNADTDGDGLLDGVEVDYDSNPFKPDSDDDGLPDGWEVKHELDHNDDGSSDPDSGPDGDPDEDGLKNKVELTINTNPWLADSDEDELEDSVETNTGKFVSDTDTGTDPSNADTDGDGLNDGAEFEAKTNPFVADSDGDGLPDGAEVLSHSTNPLVADSDEDGYTDNEEVVGKSDPLDPEDIPVPKTIVSFSWIQSDPETGSGELTATINGIEFSGAMPVPDIEQKDFTDDPIPEGLGIVGFANTASSPNPGTPNGFHIGWADLDPVTLTGSIADNKDTNTETSIRSQLNHYELQVTLVFHEDATYSYQADVFDDPTGGESGVDVTGGKHRFAGWVGDIEGGHRHSGPNDQEYVEGPDTFAIAAGGNLGKYGTGDSVGITFGLRDSASQASPDEIGGTVFVSNVVFTGTLEQDITEETFSFKKSSEIPAEDLPAYITTASIVSFTWSQSDPDPATGSGTLTATADGIEFSAPMPVPTMNQKDKTDASIPAGKGIVGFANTAAKPNPGSPNGFHLGWSGIVTLDGTLEGKDYVYDVELTYEDGDTFGYQADVFDNPDGGADVTGGENRFAGWIGDDDGGHRHSGPKDEYVDGPDTFTISAGGNVGGNGKDGDNVGITLGLRSGTGGDVFVSNLVFTGTLQAGIPVEPPTIIVVNNGDGTVTMTFEGTLQSAATVDGPWENVDGASPLTISADQAAQFGRAVK
jgi:hypothetical protein